MIIACLITKRPIHMLIKLKRFYRLSYWLPRNHKIPRTPNRSDDLPALSPIHTSSRLINFTTAFFPGNAGYVYSYQSWSCFACSKPHLIIIVIKSGRAVVPYSFNWQWWCKTYDASVTADICSLGLHRAMLQSGNCIMVIAVHRLFSRGPSFSVLTQRLT